MKLKKIAENYLNFVKDNCKLRTYVLYDTIYKTHIKSAFAEHSIKGIKQKDLEQYFKNKSKDLSNSSLRIILSIFKGIYKYANIDFNFKFKLTQNKQNTKQVDALTKQEQSIIERYILSRKDCYKYGILISLYTGLRIGELLALTWEDVDLKCNTIDITKTTFSISRNGETNVYTEAPKTENSIRLLSIPKCLSQIFKELKSFQKGKSRYVVSRENGKMINVRTYQKCFENLLKKLNLKHHGFHALRHTFASRAYALGEDIKTLSEILGHSSITITLKSYVHSSLEQKSNLMNKVGKMICI